jgi:histidinol-phosphatase (PHP family)
LEQSERFLVEANRLKAIYSSDITLLVGLETENITSLDLARMDTLLSRHEGQIDLVVGSVHHVDSVPIDFDRSTFERCIANITDPVTGHDLQSRHDRIHLYLEKYFDAQYDVLRHLHPEVIGHIDLCRLYMPSLDIRGYPRAWEKLRRNISYAVDYGALFEANAAALRKGWDGSYPGHGVLEVRNLFI